DARPITPASTLATAVLAYEESMAPSSQMRSRKQLRQYALDPSQRQQMPPQRRGSAMAATRRAFGMSSKTRASHAAPQGLSAGISIVETPFNRGLAALSPIPAHVQNLRAPRIRRRGNRLRTARSARRDALQGRLQR